MNPQNPNSALPKSKFDVKAVERICALPDSSIDPTDLLWCLGDPNWPIAQPAISRLIQLGEKAVPQVRQVLTGNDSHWKYDVLTTVVSHWPRSAIEQLKYELEKLVLGDGTNSEVDIASLQLLVEHNLSEGDFLRRTVTFKLFGARAIVEILEKLEQKVSDDHGKRLT